MQVVWLMDFGLQKAESLVYGKRTTASIIPQTTRGACSISSIGTLYGLMYPLVDGIISIA